MKKKKVKTQTTDSKRRRKKSHKVMTCRECGSESFFTEPNNMHIGIYCKKCGAWFKWGNKDDIRLVNYRNKGEQKNA